MSRIFCDKLCCDRLVDNIFIFYMTKEKVKSQGKNSQGKNEKVLGLEKQVGVLKKSLETEKARGLRALADLENFQRREGANKKNWVSSGVAQFLKVLLPVLLELHLGYGHTKDLEIKKVIEKLFCALEKAGLVKISPPKNTPIDANVHEVLLSKEGEKDTVVEVLEPGWRFGEIVISPAKVAAGV